jgi:hypothetical protein
MGPDGAVHGAWQSAERRVCVLISFIHNLGLTIKPIKGPPQGVYACPHNKKLATLLNNKQCVCVCVCSPFPFPPLSTSNVLVSSLRQPGCDSTSFLGAGSSGLVSPVSERASAAVLSYGPRTRGDGRSRGSTHTQSAGSESRWTHRVNPSGKVASPLSGLSRLGPTSRRRHS